MKAARVPVAREGYPFILAMGFVSLVSAILHFALAAILFLVISLFCLYFFRDPERVAPVDDDAIVSPADGKVILIEKVFDEHFVREHVYKVSIFMNIFNVHVNRVPFPGRVVDIKYAPGTFYAANTERGALANESCGVVVECKPDWRYAVVQVAGVIARRIVCRAERGDELARGERFGLIRFGSRVDLYLPQNVQLEVEVGQKVKAGESVLGYLA